MPKTHTCQKCAKVFKQKSHYDEHQKKKIDCASQTNLDRIIEEKVEQKVNERVQEVVRAVIQPTVTTDVSHLQSFFENLHNLLWNKVGLNPENALKHMTLFFAYRMMELQADILQLPNECRWSYISSLTSAENMDKAIKKGIVEFRKNPITKPFFFVHDVKKVDVMHDIILLINRISTEDLQRADTLGEIFEYMLGRGMSTMADEGQYFTNRIICKLAFTLAYRIKGTVRRPDGTLCTFADWFCGTGGFTTEYIKGVKANDSHVDWKQDKMAIYSQDQNESSVTTTLLNALITTGQPFSPTTIRMTNSFSDPIIRGRNAPFPELTIDYCFMNPPYGGDKSKGKAYKFAYAKGKGHEKQFLVNEDIRTIGIEDDDKVSAGVQLGMATLAEGGVCCIVLPQGFFFGASKKCVELRKKLSEEYKIWYVVDIASGSFLNTGTKTSMMVFQKGVGATDTVTFMGLDETVLVEATLEELRAKNYSLNYKQYMPQSVVEVDGFEMVKLGDICEFYGGQAIKKEDRSENGKIPYYGSNGIVGYMDTHIFDGKYIITGQDGTLGTFYNVDGMFWASNHTHVFRPKNNAGVLLNYVFYYLSTNFDPEKVRTGSCIPKITLANIKEVQIPLPSLERQKEIVDSIDGFTQLAHAEEQSLKMLEKSVMFEVKWMGMGKERVKLETIAKDITFGFMISSDDYGNEGVPVIKTKNIKSKRLLYPACEQKIKTVLHDKYRIKKGDMMIVLGGSPGETGMWEFDEDAWLNQDCAKISIENQITKMYVFYSLQGHSFDEYIEANTTKTTIGHISRGVVREIEIPLPSLAEQQTLQSDFDEIRHKHAKISEYKAKTQAAIQRLIPGANSQQVVSEAHSSTCQYKDGTGCVCRVPQVTEHDNSDSESDSDAEYDPDTWEPKEKAATAASK